MKTPEQLRKLAAALRAQAQDKEAVKCAQVLEGMSTLKLMERRLNS